MAKTHVSTTINGEPVEFLCDPTQSLLDVLRDDTEIARTLSGETLERLTDPQHYLGAADTFVSRVLALADAALALNLSGRKSQ